MRSTLSSRALAHLRGDPSVRRVLARACARLRAPHGRVVVSLDGRAVAVAELGLPEGFERSEPWEGSLAQRIATRPAPLAVADVVTEGLPEVARRRLSAAGIRAFIAAPFGGGRGALVVWDRRARDIEPAALTCLAELAAGLDALLAGEVDR